MKHTISFLIIGVDSASAITLLRPYAQTYHISLQQQLFSVKASQQDKGNMEKFLQEVRSLFGVKLLFTKELAQTALNLLAESHYTLSTAESCTGGLLSYKFTQISGASQAFLGGVISYDNSIKEHWLNVDSYTLQQFGAVSEAVVAQMCRGILHLSGADFALATSGIAGPTGGSEQKPVGLVYIGVQQRGNAPKIECHLFKGSRKNVQKQTTQNAIIMLIREILHL